MNNPKNPYNKLIASNNENLFTGVFCDFFIYGSVRKILLKLIDKPIPDFNYSEVSTQNRDDQYGQPDFAINGESYYFVFEVKINNAQLSPKQPDDYLKKLLYLSGSQKKGLYFIIPKGYQHKDELRRRHQTFSSNNSISDIKFKIIYWEDILKNIEEAQTGNPYLEFFMEACSSFLSYRKMTFNTYEILLMFNLKIDCNESINKLDYDEVKMAYSSPIPTIYKKLRQIDNEVYTILANKKYAVQKKWGGWFIQKDNQDVLGVGIWDHFWEYHGKPYSYCVNINSPYADKFLAIIQCH